MLFLKQINNDLIAILPYWHGIVRSYEDTKMGNVAVYKILHAIFSFVMANCIMTSDIFW